MGYFSILRVYARSALFQHVSFRFHMVLSLLNSLIGFAVSFGAILLLFNQTNSINGWSKYELIGLTCLYTALRGLMGLFLLPSLERFVTDVADGEYDHLLLTPIDSFRHTLVRSWNSMAFIDIGIGVFGILFAIVQIKPHLSVLEGLELLICLTSAVFICAHVMIAASTLAFWFKRSGWNWVFQTALSMGQYPVNIYPKWLTFILTWILPIGFITTVPMQVLFDGGGWSLTGISVIIALLSRILAKRLYHLGIRQYMSASG
ncbi:ABC transporter permease [Paenibacillus psychroresistens]|nr:ABC-2 family transporter protein [Paenibacillus psychroresistens]